MNNISNTKNILHCKICDVKLTFEKVERYSYPAYIITKSFYSCPKCGKKRQFNTIKMLKER